MSPPPMKIKTFIRSSEGNLTSYSYTDIADGTGIIQFYGGKLKNSSGSSQVLSTKIFRSAYAPWTAVTATGDGVVSKQIDLDFDASSFNTYRILKGKAIVNIPITYVQSGSNGSVYCIAKIRKWDGSTETEIASGQSETIGFGLADIDGYFSIPIDVPRTNFKKGETLRLTIEGWMTNNSGGTFKVAIHYDINNEAHTISLGSAPNNLSVLVNKSLLQAFIPFEIQD